MWPPGVSVQSKFEEIRKSNQAAAQRLVESRISCSSSDEDDDDDGAVDHNDGKRGKILSSTFTTYTDQTGEPGVTIATAGYLDTTLLIVKLIVHPVFVVAEFFVLQSDT